MSSSVAVSSFLKAIAKFSVPSWINFFIGVTTVLIATRIFTPDVYGAINIFNTSSAAFVGLACLGMDNAFIRFYHEPPEGVSPQELFTYCFLLSIGGLLLFSAFVLIFFHANASNYLFHQENVYLVALICVNGFSLLVLNNYFSQYYRMSNDPYHYTIQQILVQFFAKTFVIGSVFFEQRIDTVLTINTVGLFLFMLVCAVIQGRKIIVFPRTFSWEKFSEVVRFGIFIWPLSTLSTLNAFVVPFLIVSYLDSYQVGIYSAALFFVSAFGVIQSGFRTYWSTFMYKNYQDEQSLIIRVHNFVVLGILLVLGLFILCQHGIYQFIGQDFRSSRLFFTLVLIDPLLLLLEQTTGYGTSIAKKNYQDTIIYVAAVLLNILLCISLLPHVGLIGAAIASMLAAVVRFLLSSWRGQIYYKSISSIRKTLLGVALILAMAISNVVLTDKMGFEIFVVITIDLFAILAYRRDVRRIVDFLERRKCRKNW